MSNVERIQIKREILFWALQESQKEKAEVFGKFPQMADWINGTKKPTFKQLQNLAAYLKIPLGYLFLKTSPQTDIMEVEFRSINSKLPDISKNLKDTIMSMDIKRNWMSDYRRDLGWDKLTLMERFSQQKNNRLHHDALLAKKLLGLNENWYTDIKNQVEAYNFLKNKIEEQGILVMQNGIVNYNTRRKLDINEFRAFMLYDDVAPLVFINSNDSWGGKIFSLIHEFIHVLFGQENLFLQDDLYSTKENEKHINRLTGEFLMPGEDIRVLWDKSGEPFEQIERLANLFKVSKTALAIKLKELTLIGKDVLDTIIAQSIKYFKQKIQATGTGGGDFYNTFNTRISPTFTKAVIRSTEAGRLEYTYAFRLLGGIKGKTYDEIKERVLPYG